MDRWDDYRAGKLKLPAIVQEDRSGVLVATDSGFAGPYSPRKDWTAAQYAALMVEAPEPEPEEDYRTKYETLRTRVNAIDTSALKATIVAELEALKTESLSAERLVEEVTR
jgi:hypothetical protein